MSLSTELDQDCTALGLLHRLLLGWLRLLLLHVFGHRFMRLPFKSVLFPLSARADICSTALHTNIHIESPNIRHTNLDSLSFCENMVWASFILSAEYLWLLKFVRGSCS